MKSDTSEKKRHKRPSSATEVGRFPDRLREIIGDQSIRAFAQAAQLSPSVLQQYLKGESEPTRPVLNAIASMANVSVEWLATGNGPKKLDDSGSDWAKIIRNARQGIFVWQVEEAKWTILREAFELIDLIWFSTVPGEPNDPIPDFVAKYNKREIFQNSPQVFDIFPELSPEEFRQWGKSALAWLERTKEWYLSKGWKKGKLAGEGDMRRGKGEAAAAPLDEELLEAVVEAVEEYLDQVKGRLKPDKKAKLVAALYDMYYADEEKAVDKATVIRLVKLAV